jgi:capsular exopolysaccharide synthesis family protein
MSRVYDALRLSELERGAPGSLFDPDSFLAPQSQASTLLQERETATNPGQDLESFATLQAALPVTVDDPRESAFDWDQVLSVTPVLKEESRIVTLTDEHGLATEKFRLLRARIRHMRERQQLRRLVITSAVPNDGKTFVAMNLAVALSKHSSGRTLLLEGDLRKPTLGKHLGISALPGIGEWAGGNEPINRFMCRVDKLQLWVLPAGAAPEDPTSILHSPRFLEMYEYLSTCFDWIVIDAPPLLPMADVSFWSRQSDGLLLVIREGQTPKALLKKGLETLDNPKIVGLVLNDAADVGGGYYSQYRESPEDRKHTLAEIAAPST